MKGTNQSANYWDFWELRSKRTKFLPFLKQQIGFSPSFASISCQNHIKFPLKKYRRVLSWYWRVMQNLKKKLHPTTQKSENFTSMGSFCPKYIRFELKNYREVIFHGTGQWYKIWINPGLVISKMAWGIKWTFVRPLKNLKTCSLMSKAI